MGANREKVIVTPEGFSVPFGKEMESEEPSEKEVDAAAKMFAKPNDSQ
jgi:hypothetical protein